PSINRANEADSGGHVSLGAKCQAPIRSRRRSSGGGGRHNIRRSDHLVDRKSMSQPVASPGTNRSGRTSPPRETFSVRKSSALAQMWLLWESVCWARADDVAKRRRQGLVVCRAPWPLQGPLDACPGVTLAPTFLAAACQSATVRL